ncbi:MAG: hypothetical protein AB7N61_21025 [Acidimicrobiia bacterium]
MLIDEPAITKQFDYVVPPEMRDHVRVGTMVRVSLGPRRVGGWIVAIDPEPSTHVALKPIAKVTGWGPSPDVIDLCRWVAWRWAGRVGPALVAASPPGAVPGLPAPERPGPAIMAPMQAEAAEFFAGSAGHHDVAVLRLPPASDPMSVVMAAVALGDVLVVTASVDAAKAIAARLRRSGRPTALVPRDWARAAAGGSAVVGARAAVLAPCPGLAAVVVLDEHDEALAEERVPCWHARDVAIERARRAGVPCLLVSPCPSLESLQLQSTSGASALIRVSRSEERAGWPLLDVIDRSRDLPSESGPISPRLSRLLHRDAVPGDRGDGRVVCVLNRTGTARILGCSSCGALARCERCGASVSQRGDSELECRRCSTIRPMVCIGCGSTRLSARRPGVARIRADLVKMLGEPVAELTANSDDAEPAERVVVGTEAALHRVRDARIVAFLDIDDELTAPRYRAAEQAMSLLARAARLVGGRSDGGRIVVQSRLPRHPVLDAVLLADPGRLAAAELEQRRMLRFPPSTAMAAVSGPVAGEFIAALADADRRDVEILGPADDQWLVRAEDHRTLCDALRSVARPQGRMRIEVDPLRV